MKAYKLRFYPTAQQRKQLAKEFNACRYVWNWALKTRSDAYKKRKESLNAVALSRMLTIEKTLQSFLRAGSATAFTYVLKAQDEAFKKFFNKQGKYPKFKRRYAVESCTYQLDKRRGDKVFKPNELLTLPKLGKVKVIWSYKDITVMPNSATVSCNPAGQWFISLQCDYLPASPSGWDKINLPETDKIIGLDFGLTTFVADSNGNKIKPRKFYAKYLRKLKIAQRNLSRKVKGSSNRAKARTGVARIHQRIASKRANFLHGLSTSIVRENQVIAIEDLNVRGVMANGKLARAVGDCGWYELRRQLTYKAKWYGRQLITIGRFERSTGICPDCGAIGEKLPLNIRAWECKECNSHHDRDIAAAKIILQKALNTVRSTGIPA